LELSSEVANGLAIFRIVGKIDGSTVANLESSVSAVIHGGSSRVIFDMREVTYISSAGLRGILSTAKQATAAKGGLAIFGVQPAVNEVFEVSGFQSIIPIVADESQARSHLSI
jgi:anti-anti-sigma factor